MNRYSNQKAMVVVPRKKQQKVDKERLEPPSFLSLPVMHRRLRFRNTATTDQTFIINAIGIFCALGFIPDNLNDRAYACRTKNILIKKIQVWAAPKSDSSDAFKTASIDWHNSTGYCSGKKKSDTSISNTRCLYISSKPPKNSVSNFWIESSNTEIVTLHLPPSAIVDLSVNYTINEGLCAYASMSNFTIGSPVLNTVYHGRLDFNSSANSGGYLIPVDLVTF